jgi:hypothetical protein
LLVRFDALLVRFDALRDLVTAEHAEEMIAISEIRGRQDAGTVPEAGPTRGSLFVEEDDPAFKTDKPITDEEVEDAYNWWIRTREEDRDHRDKRTHSDAELFQDALSVIASSEKPTRPALRALAVAALQRFAAGYVRAHPNLTDEALTELYSEALQYAEQLPIRGVLKEVEFEDALAAGVKRITEPTKKGGSGA